MDNASRDKNFVTTLLGVSNVDGVTPIKVYADETTHRLLVDQTGTAPGTVTAVSVVTANGVSGSVANPNSTPAITLTLGSITPSAVQVSGLTASEIVATDASKNLVSLDTATYPSLTELSYVKGVTSGIQSQINAKGVGTVTAVSVATANGFSGSSTGGATPSLTIVAGAITPTSINGLSVSTGNNGVATNIAIGRALAGPNTGGGSNYGLGLGALNAMNTGLLNLGLGYRALYLNADGAFNVAVGATALNSNVHGNYNVAVGVGASNAALGDRNVALGFDAGGYETGSDSFYVDNQDRTNTAGDKAKALLYGTFNATASSQTLVTNSAFTATYGLNIPTGQTYKINSSPIVASDLGATAAGDYNKFLHANAATGVMEWATAITSGASVALDNLAAVAINANLQFNNTADYTFNIAPTANTVAGKALAISAGSTVTGGTVDMAGGNLTLNSGLGKGTGASSIIFQTGKTLTTGSTLQTLTTAMTILGSGNVGIGTITPYSLLDVSSITGGTLTLSRNDTSVTANDVIGTINFWTNDTQTTTNPLAAYIQVIAKNTIATDINPGVMKFYTTPTGVAAASVLALTLDETQAATFANTVNATTFVGALTGTASGNITSSVTALSSLVTVGTITSGGLGTGATIGGVTMALGSDAVGDIYAATASNVLSRVAAVAVGQVLISKGVTTLPAWSASATLANLINTSNAITATANAATVPVTSRLSTVTNNSAATLTITITTASAVDGQLLMVRILDATGVAQTVAWVNTENSTVTAPTTSNGSTTLPLTVGFQYNNATSKWRCIASA